MSGFVRGGDWYLGSVKNILEMISMRSISLRQWKSSTKSSSTEVGIRDSNLTNK